MQFTKMPEITEMNNFESSEGDGKLLGVSLVSESYISDLSNDVSLGVLVLRSGCDTTSLSTLRSMMLSQVAALPTSFSFFTKEGWPVNKFQESTIKVSHIISQNNVIRIHRNYSKPRVGVKSHDGTAVGFVFIDHNSPVSTLREVIHRQLGSISCLGGCLYQFQDRNGWPVSVSQERILSVMDLLKNATVCISPGIFVSPAKGTSASTATVITPESPPLISPQPKRIKYTTMKQLTFQTSKDQDRKVNAKATMTTEPKQVLLSYVRSEAAQHAVSLKKELTRLGYSVFLDVHEIKLGVDWQDSLNYAVSNCEAFIPLVTPRYGETQWTNREVKLADVLSKFILPVSFLDHWPPKCLAIQFATTQYIPWKSPEALRTSPDNDISNWGAANIASVAHQIGDRLKSEFKDVNHGLLGRPQNSLTKKMSTLRSCPFILPEEFQQLSQHREGLPLVVISLHPEQRSCGEMIQNFLIDEGYEVWLSTSLHNNEEDALSDTGLFSQSSMDMDQIENATLTQLVPANTSNAEFLLRFQEKADAAGVVIFLLSKAFACSKTCQQQVFYCERRKRVIPVQTENFRIPGWMSMLIGTGSYEDIRVDGFENSLKERVHQAFFGKDVTNEDTNVDIETCLGAQVRSLKEKLPKAVFVYIAGSATDFYYEKSEAICKAIGRELAKIPDLYIATGGFFGVGETVGRSYEAERQNRSEISNIFHILPIRDDQDRSAQCRQNADKTFQVVPYGKTVFAGDRVRERENIVSRAFDICVLVEGGPGAAHEAEQFAWNGNIVVPVKCTGGAAGGKFNVPSQIFEKPLGVTKNDWQMLSKQDGTPDEIGQSVASIVHTLRDRLKMDSPSYIGDAGSYFDENLSQSQDSGGSPLKSPSLVLKSPKKRKSDLTKENTFILK